MPWTITALSSPYPGLGDVNLCSETGAGGGCGTGGYASILWDGGSYQFTQVNFSQLSQSEFWIAHT